LKIQEIEQDLKKNHETISLIKETVQRFAKEGDSKNLAELQKALNIIERQNIQLGGHLTGSVLSNITGYTQSTMLMTGEMCQFSKLPSPKIDVQVMICFTVTL